MRLVFSNTLLAFGLSAALVAGLATPSGAAAAPTIEKKTGLVPAPDYWPASANVAIPKTPYKETIRSVSLEDLDKRGVLPLGIYNGTPQLNANLKWYEDNFYATLAAKKVWNKGTSPKKHEFQGPITWSYVPIPQKAPPPCDQPQPTGYDADSCRYVLTLFKDIEAKDPAKATALRNQVRRGRDVWYKGTFGNQDEPYLHFARAAGGQDKIWYPWLDTRERKNRFTKYGLINDPDCTEGDASTNWWDKCQDPHSSGVLGYRKYYADPTVDEKTGKVVFDPKKSPYQKDELQKNMRYVVGHPCIQCHVGMNPNNPPANPNEPKWENLSGTIGNQHIIQPLMFFQGADHDAVAKHILKAGRPGTIDTSLVANDFMNNPGTQNNIMDFQNRRVFKHKMKDPITGEIKEGLTQNVLKGGEDSVGDRLALIRVYVNIGMCTEECWTPNFPTPGKFLGERAKQSPFSIKQCAAECEPWNYADAKMHDLAAYLITGGPNYLLKSQEADGTPGSKYVDLGKVPQGRKIFAQECASCHSSKVAPENIRRDKAALARFYEGHVFGSEEFWQYEFTKEERESAEFISKYLTKDAKGNLKPKQFAEKGVFGQDWLGSDEPTPFHEIGTNMCRAMHDNHNKGQIWEEFSSETFKQRKSPGKVDVVMNRMVPGLGGVKVGEKEVTGGPGYYRNISLLSAWATSPFLHNNAIGEMPVLKDGTPDVSIRGRIKAFEDAFAELMMSDDPNVKPSRPQKISKTDRDLKIAPREDMQGPIKLPVAKGTPYAHFASSDPHRPITQKCDDLVENKGHQFGVSLTPEQKTALREFLKVM
jgi:hypothetical protein